MSQFQVSGIILEMWALNQVFFEIWIAHNMHDDQFYFLLASTNSRFHTTDRTRIFKESRLHFNLQQLLIKVSFGIFFQYVVWVFSIWHENGIFCQYVDSLALTVRVERFLMECPESRVSWPSFLVKRFLATILTSSKPPPLSCPT